MKKYKKTAITSLIVIAVLGILSQIDLVRQQVEIALLKITRTQWVLHGRLQRIAVFSPALRQNRAVYIYTPPGYDDQVDAERRYPTLYLLHGSPDLNAISWVPYGRAPQLVDQLVVEGRIPPMIVVCPDGHGPGSYGDSEYIDAPDPRVVGKPGTRVATFITKDLLNYIDANYRTMHSANSRWLGGVSTGGYGAVNLGLQHPDLYGTVVSLSGYFVADPSGDARRVWGYHPSPQMLQDDSPAYYAGTPNDRWTGTFIFLGAGANERGAYKAEAAAFAKKLTSSGIPYITDTRRGHHSWDLWRQLLRDALLRLRARIPGATLQAA